MWNDPAAELERELSPGERLVWSGQPRGGVRLRASDAVAIPFSIFWCGFAVLWEVIALLASNRGGGLIALVFPLFGVPFVVIGLYLLVGRFFVDAKARQRTFYGVTTERIVIVSGLFARRTRSLNLRTLGAMSLAERPDGSGTITFGPASPFGHWFAPGGWPGAAQFASASFEMIERAREVHDLIRQTQKSLT
jgi:hypothetical protein